MLTRKGKGMVQHIEEDDSDKALCELLKAEIRKRDLTPEDFPPSPDGKQRCGHPLEKQYQKELIALALDLGKVQQAWDMADAIGFKRKFMPGGRLDWQVRKQIKRFLDTI